MNHATTEAWRSTVSQPEAVTLVGITRSLLICLVLVTATACGSPPAARTVIAATSGGATASSPIRHVVIIEQENHSFDNVLGPLCVQDQRCAGATSGRTAAGSVVPLAQSPDVVPAIAHNHATQVTAMDGGRMDGFSNISGCGNLQCYVAYQPGQIPDLARLARTFALSDATFETNAVPSWGSHLELVASQLDGFVGDNPVRGTGTPGPGWGCDSHRDALWQARAGAQQILVPSCVPTPAGPGPYRPSPVKYVPTILDRMQSSHVSWALYGGAQGDGYGWSICPTFAQCLLTKEHANTHPAARVITDATSGALPAVSIVTPTGANSQHNGFSMLQGDNWIGRVVNAVESGPDWSTTAIFITYDDCGCFYDHIKPPAGLGGIRVPMVIVSPYARPGHTDSTPASPLGLLAFIEHTFALKPLSAADAHAYDYAGAFNYAQTPLAPVPLGIHPLSTAELKWLAAHRPWHTAT
jgi:phospholipase C